MAFPALLTAIGQPLIPATVARGLMAVLQLASQGLAVIRQDVPYGPIMLQFDTVARD